MTILIIKLYDSVNDPTCRGSFGPAIDCFLGSEFILNLCSTFIPLRVTLKKSYLYQKLLELNLKKETLLLKLRYLYNIRNICLTKKLI